MTRVARTLALPVVLALVLMPVTGGAVSASTKSPQGVAAEAGPVARQSASLHPSSFVRALEKLTTVGPGVGYVALVVVAALFLGISAVPVAIFRRLGAPAALDEHRLELAGIGVSILIGLGLAHLF